MKRKNGNYYIQFFDPQTNQIRRLSTKTKSKREAQSILKRFNPTYKKPVKKINLSVFRDEYVRHLTGNKSSKYIKSITLSFRQLINYSNDIPLQSLTVRSMDQFISERFSTAPSAALMYYRTLKAAFTKAVNWEYFDENPLVFDFIYWRLQNRQEKEMNELASELVLDYENANK
jgi:hypothetical protein